MVVVQKQSPLVSNGSKEEQIVMQLYPDTLAGQEEVSSGISS